MRTRIKPYRSRKVYKRKKGRFGTGGTGGSPLLGRNASLGQTKLGTVPPLSQFLSMLFGRRT